MHFPGLTEKTCGLFSLMVVVITDSGFDKGSRIDPWNWGIKKRYCTQGGNTDV